MDILNRILDLFLEAFKISPLEMLFIFSLLAIFFWLSKELRIQKTEEIGLQKERTEKALHALSQILTEGKNYGNGMEGKVFFHSVYSAIPFLEYRIAAEMLELIDQENLSESEKISAIYFVAKKEILVITSSSNKNLLKTKLIIDDLESIFSKFGRIFEPFYISGIIIFSILLLLSIDYNNISISLIVAKTVCFIISSFFLVMGADLVIEKSLKLELGIYIFLVVVTGYAVTISSEKYTFYILSIFIICFSLFVYFLFKQRALSRNTI